jgi:hypothetical protein
MVAHSIDYFGAKHGRDFVGVPTGEALRVEPV